MTRAPVLPRAPKDPDSMGPPIQFVRQISSTNKNKGAGAERHTTVVGIVAGSDSSEEEGEGEPTTSVGDSVGSKGKEVQRSKSKSIPAPVVAYHDSRPTFPALWIDIEGEIIDVLWKKAIIWVEGTLMFYGGSTLVRCTFIFLFEGSLTSNSRRTVSNSRTSPSSAPSDLDRNHDAPSFA